MAHEWLSKRGGHHGLISTPRTHQAIWAFCQRQFISLVHGIVNLSAWMAMCYNIFPLAFIRNLS